MKFLYCVVLFFLTSASVFSQGVGPREGQGDKPLPVTQKELKAALAESNSYLKTALEENNKVLVDSLKNTDDRLQTIVLAAMIMTIGVVAFLCWLRKSIQAELRACNERLIRLNETSTGDKEPSPAQSPEIKRELEELKKLLSQQRVGSEGKSRTTDNGPLIIEIKRLLSEQKNELIPRLQTEFKNHISGQNRDIGSTADEVVRKIESKIQSIISETIAAKIKNVFGDEVVGLKDALSKSETTIQERLKFVDQSVAKLDSGHSAQNHLTEVINKAVEQIEEIQGANNLTIAQEYGKLIERTNEKLENLDRLSRDFSTLKSLENEKEQLMGQLSSREERMREAEQQRISLQRDLQEANKVVREDYPALLDAKAVADRELANDRKKIEELQARIQRENRELEDARALIQQAAAEVDSLTLAKNQVVESLAAEKQSLEQKMNELNISRDNARDSNSQRLAALADLAVLEESIYPKLLQSGGALFSWKGQIEDSVKGMNPHARVLRGLLGAFSAMVETGKGELQLSLLGEISRSLTDWLYSSGHTNVNVHKALHEWAEALNKQYSGRFSLKVPDLGEAVTLAWMSPTAGSLQVVSGVVTWMVRTPSGSKFSGAVVK